MGVRATLSPDGQANQEPGAPNLPLSLSSGTTSKQYEAAMFPWKCESCGAPAEASSAYLLKATGWAVSRRVTGHAQTAVCPRCLGSRRAPERFAPATLVTKRYATRAAP